MPLAVSRRPGGKIPEDILVPKFQADGGGSARQIVAVGERDRTTTCGLCDSRQNTIAELFLDGPEEGQRIVRTNGVDQDIRLRREILDLSDLVAAVVFSSVGDDENDAAPVP